MGGTIPARRVRVAVGIAAVALLAIDLVAFRDIANRARPVSMDTVVARYRDRVAAAPAPQVDSTAVAGVTTAPAAPAATGPSATRTLRPTAVAGGAGPRALAMPAPGVYVYATKGGESTDAVGGAHHTYPDQTTITVTPSSCGFTMRWDALEQRWDDWTECVDVRALAVHLERMHHEFYTVKDDRSYTCTGAMFRPGGEAAGTPLGGECGTPTETSRWSGQVVGRDTVIVGGVAVPAIHVSLQEQVTGDTSGTRHSELWFAEDSALVLKRISSVVGTSMTSVGRVHYSEDFTIQLTSLTPTR